GRNDGKGYNTDASGGQNRQSEISGGSNTRSVPLNSIPTVAVDADQAGACESNVIYREFRFDGQAPGAQDKQEYSLDDIRVYLVPNESPNNAISDFLVDDLDGPRVNITGSGSPELVWDMNEGLPYGSDGYPGSDWDWLLVSSAISSGQGASDLRLLIPNDNFLELIPQEDYQACAFTGFDYSAGGTTALDSDCPWLIYFVSSHGFSSEKESGNSEWSVAFRPTLLVSKTAVGKYDQTYDWSVEKSVDQDAWDLFEGDEATAAYEVTATKGDPVDHNVRIEGVITLENVSDEDVTVTGIRDVLSLEVVGDNVLDYEDMDCDFELGDVIPAGESRSCSYRQDLGDDQRGLAGTNEVVVTAADPLDAADDGSLAFAGYAPVTWSEEPEVVRNDDVDVKDVLADGGDGVTQIDENISESTTFDYEHTFACDADEGGNTNTVTVYGDPLETGGDPTVLASDDETVTISCYELDVTKDATTEFTRTFDWEIDKYAGPESDPITEIEIMPLQSYLLRYTVDVNTTGYTDSDWKVYGDITVSNPAPIGVELTGVSDVVSTDIDATVDCGVTFPYMLASGDDLECSYEADLPDGSDGRVNTATATIQNRGFFLDESGALDSEDLEATTDFTGTADVVFGDPTTLVNQCVDVSDAFDGEDPARDLGEV
ncbi:MAG: hypothetical protein R3324_06890, partial [Halobacteriales archaeon]|nr:hypothetical protein [Halobacteriales archaeon]